ncbi:redox-regulated ATPase YchF [Candidatus Woesearchaeota archaeon]|nr:redox-regulated ATPase YchF [Candidatus Woesearchaeota archaeon]
MLIGVVGKANVGKSTFFKALTLAEVEIANYPFATIKPNHGVGHVRIECVDKDFGKQCNPREGFCIHHERFVPVDILDVAGLVPGAHEGKGMGNQFLDDLRQADCLIHVIDAAGTTNESGEPVEPGSYDPAEDIRFLEVELDMWYMGIIKKGWEKFARQMQQEHLQPHRAIGKQLSGLGVNEKMVEACIKKIGIDPEKPSLWTESDLLKMASELRKRTKPMVIAANKADVKTGCANIDRLRSEFPDHLIIPCSAESELALKSAAKHGMIDYVPGNKDFCVVEGSGLNERQKAAFDFIKKTVLDVFGSTGVQQALNEAVLRLLGYIAVFPGGVNKLEDQHGNTLPDCFLMPPGSTALDFAYRLHTDFGKNFIRAIDVKKKMTVGKEHKLNHRDVIEIVSGK